MDTLEDEARKMFRMDYLKECEENGKLTPTVNKDPINPPLLALEYEAMEKDRAKYFLYYSAIYFALKDWTKLCNIQQTCHIMVVGAGRGRLVEYCMECFDEFNIHGFVYVVEVNKTINSYLKERFKDRNTVHVLKPFVVRTASEILTAVQLKNCDSKLKSLLETKPIDFFVTELFGSFGDNEFVAEILSTSFEVFGKKDCNGHNTCISIPHSYSTYVCGIHSKTLDEFYKSHSREQLYILGLPEDVKMLSELTEVYEALCTEAKKDISCAVMLNKLDQAKTLSLSGFAGYFQAKLYGNISINTTPTAKQNTYFWEAAFFPVSEASQKIWANQAEHVHFSLTRKCDYLPINAGKLFDENSPVLKMWYEWAVGNDSEWQNVNGVRHSLHL